MLSNRLFLRKHHKGLILAILALLIGVNVIALGTECTREHHGDLVIKGGQVFTISDETFCQYGDIDVRDNARLVITNGTIQMEGSNSDIWGNKAYISIHDSASVEIHDSSLEVSGGGVWINAFDNSHVVLSNAKSTAANGISLTARGHSKVEINRSTVMELRIQEQATADIWNSDIVWGVDLIFEGRSHAEVDGLVPGHYDDWETPQWEGVAFQLQLSNTDVGAWSVKLAEQAQVIIRDSILDRIGLVLDGASGKISGLRPGLFPSWSLKDNNDIQCPCDLSLENTTLRYEWALGFSDRSKLAISDSDISGLGIWGTYVDLAIKQTQIKAIQAYKSMGNISFADVSVTRGFEFENSMLTMVGALTCSASTRVAKWRNSTVLRGYDVRLTDSSRSPAAEASLKLESPNGQSLSAVTDKDGLTSINVNFDDSDYSKDWILTATLGDQSVSCPIGFMSSSPIKIRIPSTDTAAADAK